MLIVAATLLPACCGGSCGYRPPQSLVKCSELRVFLRLGAGGGCFAWAFDLGVPWSCVGLRRGGCPCRVPPICVASTRTNRAPRRLPCSYHADLVPAVSMATVALDCYSSNCHHGNSLQPWSLGAGIIREKTEDKEMQLMQFGL